MHSFKFWDDWLPGYRRTFQVTGFLLIVLFILLLVSIARDPGPTVTWQTIQEREVTEEVVHRFQSGPFALQVPAENTSYSRSFWVVISLFQEWPVYAYLLLHVHWLYVAAHRAF